MTTLYLHAPDDAERWRAAFRAAAPGLTVVAGDAAPAEAVRYVAAWAPPPGLFARFPGLRAVFALGAGVDRFLGRPDLPPELPLLRLLDAGMGRQMAEYALFATLWFQRGFDAYARQQRQQRWRPLAARPAEATRIGILGLGTLGGEVGRALAGFGYPVTGWRRSPAPAGGLPCLTGEDGLDRLLAESDVLLCLLPDTPGTRGLLDRRRLARLPEGAGVVNMGRGSLIVVRDLLDLLDAGHLRGAVLDVAPDEPPPPGDLLWSHPRVLLTPHIAAVTLPEPSARQIAANIARIEAGERPEGLVDRGRGY